MHFYIQLKVEILSDKSRQSSDYYTQTTVYYFQTNSSKLSFYWRGGYLVWQWGPNIHTMLLFNWWRWNTTNKKREKNKCLDYLFNLMESSIGLLTLIGGENSDKLSAVNQQTEIHTEIYGDIWFHPWWIKWFRQLQFSHRKAFFFFYYYILLFHISDKMYLK